MQAQSTRIQYPQSVKDLVLRKYRCCRTIDDKWALALEVADLTGSPKDDPNLLQKLYNLASRVEATRRPAGQGLLARRSDSALLELRDDPETLIWSAADDRYLTLNWRVFSIEDIAFQLNRSETAVAYRARQLGLRQVPKFYEASKVVAWLGLRREEGLDELRVLDKLSYGLVHPVAAADGRTAAELVSAPALARLLAEAEQGVRVGDSDYAKMRKLLVARVVADRGPDLFFLKDVREGVAAIGAGQASFEPSPWIAADQRDMHPFSPSRGLRLVKPHTPDFFGWDLSPADLHPGERVFEEGWRHPRFVSSSSSRRNPFEALGIDRGRLELELSVPIAKTSH